MDFILKKLNAMNPTNSWDYGNGFRVLRKTGRWSIYKNGWLQTSSADINEIAREIKLTFIAIETMSNFEEEN